jgi:hypothetical protein
MAGSFPPGGSSALVRGNGFACSNSTYRLPSNAERQGLLDKHKSRRAPTARPAKPLSAMRKYELRKTKRRALRMVLQANPDAALTAIFEPLRELSLCAIPHPGSASLI